MANSEKQLKEFENNCLDCGACLRACTLLEELNLTPGEIARQVTSGLLSKNLQDALQRCSLCGLCNQYCPEELRPAEMIQAAREFLVEQGKISLDDYDLMQVDRDWNFFSIYRSTFAIEYEDLYLDDYDTLFFPGCSLSSYAPELTRLIHTWLQMQGMKVGFTEMCCGKPLISIGLEERSRRLLERLQTQMQAAGARRLVTACPNCLHMLRDHLASFEIVSLYDLLGKAGIQLQGEELLSIHDSCPDRYDVETGKQIRSLLSAYSQVEMEHHGKETLCCGSGGIVSMIDSDLCKRRSEERIAEFSATGADRCVTACMSCAHRLSRSSAEGSVVHVLELVFKLPVNYGQIAANVKAMWEGEWGIYNQYRLSQAQLIYGKKGNA